jgi:putative sterol carrier protein
MRAIMTGRMKLSDMGLAMKLQPAIQTLFAKAV